MYSNSHRKHLKPGKARAGHARVFLCQRSRAKLVLLQADKDTKIQEKLLNIVVFSDCEIDDGLRVLFKLWRITAKPFSFFSKNKCY